VYGGEKLKRVYPEAIDKNEECFVSGFGKEAVEGKVYTIPVFILSDERVVYQINNLQIAVCRNLAIGCDFVLRYRTSRTVANRNIFVDKKQNYHNPNRYSILPQKLPQVLRYP